MRRLLPRTVGDPRRQIAMEGTEDVMNTSGADPKCFDLAEHFLGPDAEDRRVRELAFCIQSTIEDWLTEEEEITERIAAEQAERESAQ